MPKPNAPSVAKLAEQGRVADYFAANPHASDYDCARATGIERAKVYHHRRIVEQQMAVTSFESAQVTRTKLVEKCRFAQRESAEAWEKSKAGAEKKTQGKTTRGGSGNGNGAASTDFAVVTLDRSTGNPAHIKNYLAALAQEARYSGADALKIEHQVTVGAAQILWAVLVEFIAPEHRGAAQLAMAETAERYGREAARMTEAAAPMLVAPDEPIMAEPEAAPDA